MLSFADASYHCLVNSECKKASFINLRNAILDFWVLNLICVPSSLYLNFPASSGVFFVNSTIAFFDIPSLKIGDAFFTLESFRANDGTSSVSRNTSISSKMSSSSIALTVFVAACWMRAEKPILRSSIFKSSTNIVSPKRKSCASPFMRIISTPGSFSNRSAFFFCS